ncbi:MAG TPA: hypothetical protein VK038_02820 [Ornithinicoccus sp.]|nr:hypothetical protein [Ornithinicoccus sp.]
MTAPTTTPVTRALPRPRRGVVLSLARQEGRRLLRHPVMLAGLTLYLGLAVWGLVTDPSPRTSLSILTYLPSFGPGVFGILAANLLASRDARAGSTEVLSPAPARAQERVLAQCLACLAPTLLVLGTTLVLWGGLTALGRWEDAPALGHLLQGPLTVAGGTLLGVALAVWAPFRATGVVALVVMVMANLWLGGRDDGGMLFGPMVDWAAWGAFHQDRWVGFVPGDPGWHAVYLAGLGLAAAAGAVVRVAERRAPVVAVLAAAVGLAVLGGIGQLP